MLGQRSDDPRFADTSFAGDQYDLVVASLGARPSAQQQLDFLVAADEPGECRSAQCLEPARNVPRQQYPPDPHRLGDALDLNRAEITVFEEIGNQPARASGYHDRIRLGQGLQTSGEVWRLADDRLLLRRSWGNQIADGHTN